MKHYIRITVLTALLILAGIVTLFVLTSGTHMQTIPRETITVLNDIACIAETHRAEVGSSQQLFDGCGTGKDFVILDQNDNLLYAQTAGELSGRLTVETAIQKRYPYQYLKDDSGVWGSVILLDDGMDGYRVLRYRFLAGMSIGGLLMLLGMLCFGIYIQKNIITPFDRMKSFAGKVAAGRLDEPLTMDRGNLFGAFSESFDIMREELAASRQRELELQRKERELVASLSHDLKTPVTGIQVAAELLQMRLSVKAEASDKAAALEPEEIESMSDGVSGILQKAEQINALVSDLFTATLDDLGEFKVNCRDEDSGVLAGIVKSCDDQHAAVMGELPSVILNIDRKRMTQVIGNILSNSYKYANTSINVDFRLSEGFLEMCIQDHGPGVPAEELELITNKFYRGRAWEGTSTDGNGLGLYIAKMLMKKMGGDLVAESSGDGLLITLVIPLS